MSPVALYRTLNLTCGLVGLTAFGWDCRELYLAWTGDPGLSWWLDGLGVVTGPAGLWRLVVGVFGTAEEQ